MNRELDYLSVVTGSDFCKPVNYFGLKFNSYVSEVNGHEIHVLLHVLGWRGFHKSVSAKFNREGTQLPQENVF